ncbi:MAG: hypothetical protein V4488_23845 [Pseudomonadota bacterium]
MSLPIIPPDSSPQPNESNEPPKPQVPPPPDGPADKPIKDPSPAPDSNAPMRLNE